MPRPNPEGGAGESSSVASGGAGSASSAAPDVSALVEKAIAALPPELAQQAKDPKRKARSQDSRWKYGWWPDPTKANSLSNTSEGKQVEDFVLSMPFWNRVEFCLRASQPLLVALRIADGDETPAAPEIMAAMDHAKTTIKDSLKAKTDLLKEVMKRYDNRWENQMQ